MWGPRGVSQLLTNLQFKKVGGDLFFGLQVINIDKKCPLKIVLFPFRFFISWLLIYKRALTSWKRPRTACIRQGRRRSFVSAFYHPMPQIKLKGFSSWGVKTRNIVAIQLVLRKCSRTSCKVFFTRFTVPLNLTGITKRKMNHEKDPKHSSGALAREVRRRSNMSKKM